MTLPSRRNERTLRIIAGRWRGRKFRFPQASIRPTPDRVRETLFNWLAPRIEGARCLDLFAGSGALGLEALSRGAASVAFIEQDRAAAASLRQLLEQWQATGAEVRGAEALQHLATAAPQPYDLVFLDPPFAAGLLAATANLLGKGWLAPDARIYVEHARRDALHGFPSHWRELRSGAAGEVGYHLYCAGEAPPEGRGGNP